MPRVPQNRLIFVKRVFSIFGVLAVTEIIIIIIIYTFV